MAHLRLMASSLHTLAAAGLLTITLVAASPAAAQSTTFDDALDRSHRMTLSGVGAFGGISQMQAFGLSWSVSAFYVVYDRSPASSGAPGAPTAWYVVRRETGGSRVPQATEWADSRNCPGVADMLVSMEDLPLVRPDAPKIGRETQILGLVLDGVHHVFWNRWASSGDNDATVGLEVSGNVNSPVALWWKDAADGLKPCWSRTPPDGIGEVR